MVVPEINLKTADPAAAMQLPPVLDLVWAETLQDLLLDSLNQGSATLIDAAAVERVGTPCLQLLVAASRGARAAGLGFRICAASEIFRNAVSDLGLDAELHIQAQGAGSWPSA